MSTKNSQKGVIHFLPLIIVGLILIIAVSFFTFNKGPTDFFSMGGNVGPPPEEHEARKAWLSENVDNTDHETFVELDYEVPSWKELDEMNSSLSRKYPSYIKALQTYGTMPNLVEVLYFGDVIKDLGVNTEFVHANYWLNKNNELELWYLGYDKPRNMSQDEAKRALVHNILLAKKQGLAVILFPDYVQFEDGGLAEHDISAEEMVEMTKKVAMELAPIAEKYNVEYFVPVNQIENLFTSNGYSPEETRAQFNDFYQEMVPQIRKIYSGKIMYKMGGFNDWNNYEGVSLENADIFGVTVCGRAPTPESVVFDVSSSTTQAAKMSKEFNVPWFGAEFYISNESDQMMDFGEIKESYPVEELYKVGLTEFNKRSATAKGFTVHSLLGGGKIYGTAAYPLVKDFFASK